MIELSEATVATRQIAGTLTGKFIVSAVAGASPHKSAWYSGDPATYGEHLAGKVIGAGRALESISSSLPAICSLLCPRRFAITRRTRSDPRSTSF